MIDSFPIKYWLILGFWLAFGILFGLTMILVFDPLAGASLLIITASILVAILAPGIHYLLIRSIYRSNGSISSIQIGVMGMLSLIIVVVAIFFLAISGIFNFT